MIDSVTALRALYPEPTGRAKLKQLSRLDPHCCHFISLSPFLVMASTDTAGNLDASPRGGPPGFVKVLDDQTLLIPDSPGNNRVDTLTNIISQGQLGLLFMIPGVDETLRVNGAAGLCDERAMVEMFATEKRIPRLVIRIAVREAYLHCAKALMRSRLWDADSIIDRSLLPTMGQMIADQTGVVASETQEQMMARYSKDL